MNLDNSVASIYSKGEFDAFLLLTSNDSLGGISCGLTCLLRFIVSGSPRFRNSTRRVKSCSVF